MGKLTITVNDCNILRSPGLNKINPRIRITVDGMYKFHTSSKKNTFTPCFNETFTVGNTHRLAIIEVQAYNCFVLGGSAENETLLGSCRISIERLIKGEKRSREYFLASKDGTGIAGKVNITLKTDIQGGVVFGISESQERDYTQRLLRFLLRHDKSLLGDMDLIMSSLRDQMPTNQTNASSVGTNVESSSYLRDSFASFGDLMESLCVKYGCKEEEKCTLSLVVEGCTCLDKPTFLLPTFVVLVIRSPLQVFATPDRPFTVNPVWGKPSGGARFDVVDPDTFVLDVILYQVSAASHYEEIAQAQVRLSTLTRDHASRRQIFLLSHKSPLQPSGKGMLHLTLKPEKFGGVPMKIVDHVDRFYERLNRFFYRYDCQRLPQVDALVNSRLNHLDELMGELEIDYGKEPGSTELWVSIMEVFSLQSDAFSELHDKEVVVIITMSEQVVHTERRRVYRNSRTEFKESFVFDIVRETDMIKFEVVRAGQESIVYGRVDFSCLKMERGVRNDRKLYLVGAAGTPDAYLSGLLSVSFYSEQLGQPYSVDISATEMYAGRLRRYASLRIPERLHLVDIAVDTVFDIEGFLKDVAKEYGEEDDSYEVYITLLGCRQLPSRFGFSLNAYAIVSMGIWRYETRIVKNNTEPDFFDFFEFVVDRPHEMPITVVVMDRCEFGEDREIGRVVIPLNGVQGGHLYHEWLPLQKQSGKEGAGVIGVKYSVKNFNLRDTRTKNNGNSDDNNKDQIPDNKQQVQQQRPGTCPRIPSTSVTPDRHQRHDSFISRFGSFQNKLTRLTASLIPHERLPSVSSLSSSDFSSRAVSEHESIYHPTLSIMDEGIHSANEFCSLSKDQDAETNSSLTTELNSRDVSTPFSFQLQGNHNEKRLHVRVLYCDNLEEQRWASPSPYVMLSTLEKTYYTKVAFHTRRPRYNETFVFPIHDPGSDYLSITVITDTPYGKKCLGHCILSMKNVQKDTPRTRRISLVIFPHRPIAMQRGTICLTLLGENFGLDYMPSVDAESRFSDFLRKILESQVPQQLHRLEWYIGEYSLRESELLKNIIVKHEVNDESEIAAHVKLQVKNISQLYLDDRLVMSASCFIKVKVNGKKLYSFKPVTGTNGSFYFNEECDLTILHPTRDNVQLTIFVDKDGKRKCGECIFCLLDLHQNVMQERTRFIVKNVGLSSATPVGFITVSLLSQDFGSAVTPLDRESESQYVRLRNYYYYYLRDQLHLVDVKYGGIFNVEAHLQRLIEKYGPESKDHSLQIEIIRCRSLILKSGSPYCIIQVGLMQFKTSVAHGNGEYVFMEGFKVPIGIPEKEEVQVIVIMVDDDSREGTEVGRTVIPINTIIRGKETHVKLPLVYRAQTKYASLHGSIELSLFTSDFGILPDQQRGLLENNTYARMERAILRRHPEEIHRLPSIVAVAQGQDDRLVNTASSLFPLPAATGSKCTDVRVMLLGVRDSLFDEAYIKAGVDGGKTLLRTRVFDREGLSCINEEFTLDSSLNIEDTIITLKFAIMRFHISTTLCYCDFSVSQCPSSGAQRRWLRLFSPKGEPLGQLGIQVEVPCSISKRHSTSKILDTAQMESVVDDISSLLFKYSPKDLRKLDVMLLRSDDLTTIHRVYRQQFAPDVLATVYCEVHQTKLLHSARGRLAVETVVKGDVVRVVEHKLCVHVSSVNSSTSSNAEFNYPPLRIDISSCDALTFRIYGEGGESNEELCRAVISLRAVLTPQLYDMGEKITVPLVKVRQHRNRVHASVLAGSLTFSLKAPAYEIYPESVQLFPASSRNINRAFVRYYLDRICSLLQHYDVNSLVNIHQVVYEEHVAKPTWDAELPNLLFALIERWGPEVDSFSPPPPSRV